MQSTDCKIIILHKKLNCITADNICQFITNYIKIDLLTIENG